MQFYEAHLIIVQLKDDLFFSETYRKNEKKNIANAELDKQ